MTTPLILLVLMMAPCVAARIAAAVTNGDFDARGAAGIGWALLFVFTRVGHFVKTEAKVQTLLPWVPARTVLVHGTGLIEFAVAAGLLVPRWRRVTGWVAVSLLVLFSPANVYAAFHHVAMGGHESGPPHLLTRAPVQGIVILWVWWFAIRPPLVLPPAGWPPAA